MKNVAFSALFLGGLLLTAGEVYSQEPAKATVVELTGEVRYKNAGDTDWKPLLKDSEVLEGATIFTGPGSDCQLSFGDDFKSVTRIKPDSRVVLKSMTGHPQLDITTGELFALVRDLKKESSFKVATPTAIATVRGTAFSFAAEGIGNEMDSTVQVYEHVVGLNPIGMPDKEVPIGEGRGATMGPDGTIEREFVVSPEDMIAGREFVNEALDMMGFDKPQPVEAPEPKSDTASPEEGSGDDDKKAPEGPNPPGPDSGGPPDTQVDSAVDGIVMDMAQDSELSKSEKFGGQEMSHMFSNLTDLTYGTGGPEGPESGRTRMEPGMFMETMREAFTETEFFQSQPPDVQERMMTTMEGYMGTEGTMMPPPEGGLYYEGGTMPPPTGETFYGSMMDSTMMMPPPDTFFDPNALASDLTSGNFTEPEKISIINFMQAIRDHYFAHNTEPLYFSNVQTIPNFSFTLDNDPYVGTIHYDPASVLHSHTDGTFLHLDDVYITQGATSTVVLDPPTPPEVKIS